MSTVLAALLAGLALLLATPGTPRMQLPSPAAAPGLALLPLLGAAAVALLLVELDLSPLLVGLSVGTAAAIARAYRRRRAHRIRARRRDQVLAACDGLAGDLAAGLAPQHALRTMAQECPELAPVADAALLGADVPTALRTAARLPGAETLGLAAAAWDVAHRSGAGLAAAVGLAASAVRAERETARVVAIELAAALATARLLALLPLGILLLGRGMGGNPFGFLLATFPGQVCLATGLLLAWTGTVWLEHIADEVERR